MKALAILTYGSISTWLGIRRAATSTASAYGLLPDLVAHLNPLRRWEATELEAALAEELAKAGIEWVEGGH